MVFHLSIPLFWPVKPAACRSWAPSTREKPASVKLTETSRKKLCPPFLTMTLSPNPNATVTTAAQSRNVTVTMTHHHNDIGMTGIWSPAAARKSPFLCGGTATTLHPPHNRADSTEINGRITARRKTTTGKGTRREKADWQIAVRGHCFIVLLYNSKCFWLF